MDIPPSLLINNNVRGLVVSDFSTKLPYDQQVCLLCGGKIPSVQKSRQIMWISTSPFSTINSDIEVPKAHRLRLGWYAGSGNWKVVYSRCFFFPLVCVCFMCVCVCFFFSFVFLPFGFVLGVFDVEVFVCVLCLLRIPRFCCFFYLSNSQAACAVLVDRILRT